MCEEAVEGVEGTVTLGFDGDDDGVGGDGVDGVVSDEDLAGGGAFEGDGAGGGEAKGVWEGEGGVFGRACFPAVRTVVGLAGDEGEERDG